MKISLLVLVLAVAGCTAGPPPLTQTPKDAAVWNLNPGRWPVAQQSPPGTNDLVKVPD